MGYYSSDPRGDLTQSKAFIKPS